MRFVIELILIATLGFIAWQTGKFLAIMQVSRSQVSNKVTPNDDLQFEEFMLKQRKVSK